MTKGRKPPTDTIFVQGIFGHHTRQPLVQMTIPKVKDNARPRYEYGERSPMIHPDFEMRMSAQAGETIRDFIKRIERRLGELRSQAPHAIPAHVGSGLQAQA